MTEKELAMLKKHLKGQYGGTLVQRGKVSVGDDTRKRRHLNRSKESEFKYNGKPMEGFKGC